MKYLVIVLLFMQIWSCKSESDKYPSSENALDAGRQFIEYSLKGKFNAAGQYMLQDEDNQYWLSKVSQDFNKHTEEEKARYQQASINIHEVTDVVPDSITIINFSNSYKKSPQKIKVVNHRGQWLVDFKYTFSGNL